MGRRGKWLSATASRSRRPPCVHACPAPHRGPHGTAARAHRLVADSVGADGVHRPRLSFYNDHRNAVSAARTGGTLSAAHRVGTALVSAATRSPDSSRPRPPAASPPVARGSARDPAGTGNARAAAHLLAVHEVVLVLLADAVAVHAARVPHNTCPALPARVSGGTGAGEARRTARYLAVRPDDGAKVTRAAVLRQRSALPRPRRWRRGTWSFHSQSGPRHTRVPTSGRSTGLSLAGLGCAAPAGQHKLARCCCC
jgi:hypothetical protein